MSGGARDPRPRPRFVMGTAYERLSAETAPVKVSTDTMRLIKQQRLTGKKLTNSERAILYNDEAVRLRKSDLLHKANELVGKPIYDTHDATKQVGQIINYFLEDDKVRILAELTDEQFAERYAEQGYTGFSIGYTFNMADDDQVVDVQVNEVSLTKTPFFEQCRISVAASTEEDPATPSTTTLYEVQPTMVSLLRAHHQKPPSSVEKTITAEKQEAGGGRATNADYIVAPAAIHSVPSEVVISTMSSAAAATTTTAVASPPPPGGGVAIPPASTMPPPPPPSTTATALPPPASHPSSSSSSSFEPPVEDVRLILEKYKAAQERLQVYENEYTANQKTKLDQTLDILSKLEDSKELAPELIGFFEQQFGSRESGAVSEYMVNLSGKIEKLASLYQEQSTLAETFKQRTADLASQNQELQAQIERQNQTIQDLTGRTQNRAVTATEAPRFLNDVFKYNKNASSRASPLDGLFGSSPLSRKRPAPLTETPTTQSQPMAVTASREPEAATAAEPPAKRARYEEYGLDPSQGSILSSIMEYGRQNTVTLRNPGILPSSSSISSRKPGY